MTSTVARLFQESTIYAKGCVESFGHKTRPLIGRYGIALATTTLGGVFGSCGKDPVINPENPVPPVPAAEYVARITLGPDSSIEFKLAVDPKAADGKGYIHDENFVMGSFKASTSSQIAGQLGEDTFHNYKEIINLSNIKKDGRTDLIKPVNPDSVVITHLPQGEDKFFLYANHKVTKIQYLFPATGISAKGMDTVFLPRITDTKSALENSSKVMAEGQENSRFFRTLNFKKPGDLPPSAILKI